MQKFSKNPEFVKNLFNLISCDYDKLNDIMSFGLHRAIKKDAVGGLLFNAQAKILDLCTGTGDIAGILKQDYPNAHVTGVDFSPQMLDIAKSRYPDIEFLEADVSALPFEDERFDACVISFGLRNTQDIQKVIAEIYRVLKKGGYFINLDLGKPNKFFNLFMKPYMYLWVAILGKIFHGDETPYKYLAASNEDFPSPKALTKMFEEQGFFNVKNKNYAFGQIASQVSKK